MSEGKGMARMRPNNVVRLPIKAAEFYEVWLLMLRPLHSLVGREMTIAAYLLRRREELADVISDQSIIDDTLLSATERGRLCEELGISDSYLRVVLSKLRKCGFLTGNQINMRFIPDVEKGFNRFCLMFDFVITDAENRRGDGA